MAQSWVGLRADARRNRARILAAARDCFVEGGPDVPLEEIAARAGVGIATLYRRFPDRQALIRTVVLDVLSQVADEAQRALDEEPDAFQGLARYMHRALDLRASSVVPALLGRVALDDAEIGPIRDRSGALIEELINRARAEGSVRPDLAFADVSLLLIRLARPMPDRFPRALDDRLAHRHLTIYLEGLRLRPGADDRDIPGPALTLADLHALPRDE